MPIARLNALVSPFIARTKSFSLAGLAVMGLRVGAAGLALVAQVLAARVIGPESFGYYALALVWLLLLGHGSTVGTNQIVCRFLAEYRTTGDSGAALGLLRFAGAMALCAGVAVALVAVLVVNFAIPGFAPKLVLLFSLGFLAVPLLVLQDFLEAIARGLDKPLLGIGPAMIVRHLAIICGVVGLVVLGVDANSLAVMGFTIAGLITSAAIQFALLHKTLSALLEGAKPRHQNRLWFRTALPIALLDASDVLFNNADILILGLFVPAETLAFYFAATRLSQILSYVPYGISAATAQKYAAAAARGQQREIQTLAGSVTALVTGLTFAGMVGLWVLAPFLLSLFGPDYVASAHVVPILCLGIVLSAAMGPGEDVLTMLGEERACALAFGIALIANIAAGFALVPVIGMLGAAIATAGALTLRGLLMAILAHRRLGLRLPLGTQRLALQGERAAQ